MSNYRAKSQSASASFKSTEQITDTVIDASTVNGFGGVPDSVILEDGVVYAFRAHDTSFSSSVAGCVVTPPRLSINASANRAKTWNVGVATIDTACSDSNFYDKYVEGTFQPVLPVDTELFRYARIGYNTDHYILWVQEYAPSRLPEELDGEQTTQPFSGYLAKYYYYNQETLGVSQGGAGQSFLVSGDKIKTPTNGTPIVTVNGVPWTKVTNFSASTAVSLHFTYDLAEGRVTFGNGTAGAIPPNGQSVVLRVRLDGGGVWEFVSIARMLLGEGKVIAHTSAVRDRVYYAQADVEGGRVGLNDVTSKVNQKLTQNIGNQTGTLFSRGYDSNLDYGGIITYQGFSQIVNPTGGANYMHSQIVPAGAVPGSAVLTGGGWPSGTLSAVGSPSAPIPNWKLPVEAGYKTSTKDRIRLFFHYMTKVSEQQIFFIRQPDPAPPNPPNFITVAAPSYTIDVRAQGGASQYSTWLRGTEVGAPSAPTGQAKMIAIDTATVWFTFYGKIARMYATNSNDGFVLGLPVQVGDVYMSGEQGTSTSGSNVFIPGVGILTASTTNDATHFVPMFFTNFPVLPPSPGLAGTWTNPSTGEIRLWSPVRFQYTHPSVSTRRLDLAYFRYRTLSFAALFNGGTVKDVTFTPDQHDTTWFFDEGTIVTQNQVVDEST
jgi:hypothetical protein